MRNYRERQKQKKLAIAPAFAERLKSLRTTRGLSQKELARYLGVSQNIICTYEAARSLPTVMLLLDLANFFEVSLEDLVGPVQSHFRSPGRSYQQSSRAGYCSVPIT